MEKNNNIKDLLEKYNLLDKEAQLDFRNRISEGQSWNTTGTKSGTDRPYESVQTKDKRLATSHI